MKGCNITDDFSSPDACTVKARQQEEVFRSDQLDFSTSCNQCVEFEGSHPFIKV